MKTAARYRSFTGWHMTAILIGFFAIVIAVNLLMASFAIGTFGGTVVENSYVASQKYNGWLAAADKQNALGWQVTVKLDRSRHLIIAASKSGSRLSAASVSAVVRHPLGRAPDISVDFVENQDGLFISQEALPKGRWQVHVTVRQDTDTFNAIETIA